MMDTALWSVKGNNKARLNTPLNFNDNRVVKAVEQLPRSSPDPGKLRGAFRSTPLQPGAGIPIFGLVAAAGVLILFLGIWLLFFSRGGVGGFADKMGIGGFISVAVLAAIGIGVLAFGVSRLRRIVRDLGQLLLVFENAVAHVRPDGTVVYHLSDIKEVRHQSVHLEYGGMSTGTEHAYVLASKDGRELVLLGRSYATADDPASDAPLTDVERVGSFVEQKTNPR